MSTYLGVLDDQCLLCEYVVIDSETEMSATHKFKQYLASRGLQVPDAFLGVMISQILRIYKERYYEKIYTSISIIPVFVVLYYLSAINFSHSLSVLKLIWKLRNNTPYVLD
jgi:hypothetical protein